MLNDIALGRYFPGNSLLHRLDPRIKIVLLFLFLAIIFLWVNSLVYLALGSMTAALIFTAKIPLRMVATSLKPLWWIILFTFLLHFFGTEGEGIFQLGSLTATWEGLKQGGLITFRLALLIILSALLTFTTDPLALTDAIESLLSPLKRFGVPAHELAMMMTIALRFIPTIIEETDRIIKAQESRGADFTTGNILTRVKNFVPILVPLFIAAFRRADDLATAMEARCYRGGEGRTRLRRLQLGRLDYTACGVSALIVGGIFLLTQWGII
ncbi:MAG: energy-coupling factor transporter transmembrane protein EcfT [Selenomonadaceae bacterium]|nr:energy-coupling factor transporter transmembrane protein EcfT [Selenomonadaceae bacterium]